MPIVGDAGQPVEVNGVEQRGYRPQRAARHVVRQGSGVTGTFVNATSGIFPG